MSRQMETYIKYSLLLAMLLAGGAISRTAAQGTSFTYQGRLQDSGANANGSYDFQFTLWDALSGGTQQPQPSPVTVTRTSVAVANGTFAVQLDFGASAFPGADRFLEMSLRLAGGGASENPYDSAADLLYKLPVKVPVFEWRNEVLALRINSKSCAISFPARSAFEVISERTVQAEPLEVSPAIRALVNGAKNSNASIGRASFMR